MPPAYLDRSDAVELLREGVRRIGEALTLQTTGLLVVIQPVYELLERIAASAGTGDVAELSGSGHSEIAVISIFGGYPVECRPSTTSSASTGFTARWKVR